MNRSAGASWKGNGKEGHGTLSTQSTTLNNTQYSFNSRFAEGVGTNPEELLAAAHAGCFTMKLTFVLSAAGFTADTLETNCSIALQDGVITTSALSVTANVPGISLEKFQECAAEAKANCPVSKVFNLEITLVATLV